MKAFRFFRVSHKWVGIVLSVVLFNLSVTGLLLLEKKRFNWIQPPTQKGEERGTNAFISPTALMESVLAAGHLDFTGWDDVDRVDFRPGKRVYKVVSIRNNSEIQVDAMSGEILSQATRRSDMLEAWHDASVFGQWAHDWLMLIAGIGNVFLVVSGLYLWLAPAMRKRKAVKSKP